VLSDLAGYLEAYRTCELLTVSRSGIPIAWPMSGIYQPESDTFLTSTSIGYPQKAHNIRRTPQVALLFSDPTGSGLDAPPQILIQGTASCSDEIETSFTQHARLWQRLLTIQPSSRLYSSTVLGWHPMDVFYMRLYITVTPTSVSTRPALEAGEQLMIRGSKGLPEGTARRMRRFRSAVLAAVDDGGRPTLLRTIPELRDGALFLPGPADQRLAARPASLLLHRHNDNVGAMRGMVLTGSIDVLDDGFSFRADRLIEGQKRLDPATATRVIRGLRREAGRYLERRGLARPRIPWDELRALKSAIRAGTVD
jgi:general stress protein 26